MLNVCLKYLVKFSKYGELSQVPGRTYCWSRGYCLLFSHFFFQKYIWKQYILDLCNMVLIKEFVLFFFLSKWAVFFSKYDFFVRFFKIIFLPFLWRIVTGSFVLVDQFYFYIPHPIGSGFLKSLFLSQKLFEIILKLILFL